MVSDVKGKKPLYRFLKAIVTEFVHVIWIERNRRVFTKHSFSLHQLLRLVVQQSVGRCLYDKRMYLLCHSFFCYPITNTSSVQSI